MNERSPRNYLPRFSMLSMGVLALGGSLTAQAGATGGELPFPRPPSASVVGTSLDNSTNHWRQEPSHLRAGAPNVLVILLDDAGFAQSDVVGGEIHTPTFGRIAQTGIMYNRFHATAISSATRAALLTGRNHHRVGNGSISELMSDFDGYTGVMPRSSATVAEVLKDYGYNTAAFGKWHNTPPGETSMMGPFNHWPTSYGFEHFYGFLGGESDQYHPHLYSDTTPLPVPNDPKYHLSEDLARQAVSWLDQHQALEPNKPFFMYWAPGGVHAPHQVWKEWADRYKGKFDSGWDAYRARAFERQKQLGWIPADTKQTPRPADLTAWDSLSPEEKKFQARLMEVYAGFLEHTDTQAGKVVDEIERLGLRDNTLIFYVFSDNGASAEGMQGSINELLAENGIPTTARQHMDALKTYGGLDALGGPKLHEHYNAAWAWASETPFVGTKLVAGYFGGTRVPLAVSWPKGFRHDTVVRSQFLHVNDVAPTIYDVDGITPPEVVNGRKQDPLDGMSFADSFVNANAPTHKKRQYFEVLGSRAEYADGWIASVFGPRTPWKANFADLLTPQGKLAFLLGKPAIGDKLGWLKWNPDKDKWALFDLQKDYSQSTDVADAHPEKLAELKKLFDQDARDNHVYPIGAPFYAFLHPNDRPGEDRTDWHFTPDIGSLPEFAAPNIRSRNHRVTVDVDVPPQANGVLFSLGDIAGGVALYVKDGHLVYEYNGLSLVRTRIQAPEKLQAGHNVIEIDFTMASGRLTAAADVALSVNGKPVAKGSVPYTVPFAFTANGGFEVGADHGSPVSLDFFDQAPFAFNGKINDVHIRYTGPKS
ncbi:arylsulfatase [Paraburkholderia sp. GAS448]|uniref:arylsulfatase n=1 Tax=Paraburkholderia sp. GAS448 TaxID=3035136 RepID=UPI003D203BEF